MRFFILNQNLNIFLQKGRNNNLLRFSLAVILHFYKTFDFLKLQNFLFRVLLPLDFQANY